MRKINIKKCFYKTNSKNFGIASIFSKYIIIGSGYAGLTLSKLLTNVKFINYNYYIRRHIK